MDIIEKLETLLIPIKGVDFSVYSLVRSRDIFKGENFHLKKLASKDLASVKLDNIYWKFNNKPLGAYCRDIVSQFDDLEYELKLNQHNIKQQVSNSIINQLNGIIQNDSQIKDAIFVDIDNLFEKVSISSYEKFRETSIDPVFDFRKHYLETIINKIQTGLIYDTNIPSDQIYEEKPVAKQSDKIDEKKPLKKPSSSKRLGTNGFCWNKKRDLTMDTVILHTLLREHEFISKDTPINSLKDAFNCKFLPTPLQIPWTKRVKGKHSKGLLFHFIEQLEHLNFIDIILQNNELFNKLSFIFCDLSGGGLQNLDVSKSQWLNQRKLEKTPQEIELDSILYTLLYTNSN
jgi:hypothetical protein